MDHQVPQSEFLSKEELKQLTGYARGKQQAARLHAEGIPHQVRGSRVIVSRVHAREWLEGKPVTPTASWEPDFSKPF